VELDQIGRTLEAEKIEKRAIISLQDGNDFEAVPPNYLIDYAKMLSKLNRLDEASDLAQRAYDKGKTGQNQVVMGQSLLVLARIAITQKKFDRAVPLLSELDPLMHRILPPGHYAFSVLTTDRAMLALGQGNITRALDLSNQAVALGEAAIAKSKAGSFTFSTLLLNDSHIALAAGKPEQALSDADRLLAIEQSSDQEGALSAKAGNAYLARARALQAMGRHNEARAAAQVAVERLERSVGPDNPESQSARQLADLPSANR
jgi:tetratricopeptide (TPR) repeat protein